MSTLTRLSTVAVLALVGMISIAMTGEESGPVGALLACATALPGIAAIGAARKGTRLGGREGLPWLLFSGAMTLMVPVYVMHHVGVGVFEDILISGAYVLGAVAVLAVPLPDAGPYQRMVASLDALALGLVIATGTYWLGAVSGMDFAGNLVWTMSDAAIVAMLGYVAFRRSARRGVDWPLLSVVGAVGAYLAGVLITTISPDPYYVGHSADYAFFGGMVGYALAPLIPEPQTARSRNILRPVRWGHVLTPYALVGVLAVALVGHQIQLWGVDPARTGIELGLMAAMLVVLVRQLAMIAEQRRKIEVEQGGVIATISHELRTPLTTIVGFLDLLEDWEEFSDAEKADMVELARDQSHVMARVVGDLVDVARERIEQTRLDVSLIQLDEFLDAAISVVPELRGVAVRAEIAPGARLTADRDRMLQVLTNMLSNAAVYGHGEVLIVTHSEGTATVIEVHDNGPGVPDTYQHVIWERFERGAQRQSAIPGSGIGLAVARGLVRAHGGEAQYRHSNRLAGACFEISVPALRGRHFGIDAAPGPDRRSVERRE
jgi:signal transduction histidine kinase